MLRSTFTYLNCALQHEALNRGPWKDLEKYERDLSLHYSVHVTIYVLFDSSPERVPGGAAIPKGFIKTIKFNSKQVQFYFPNTDVRGLKWREFSISEQELMDYIYTHHST